MFEPRSDNLCLEPVSHEDNAFALLRRAHTMGGCIRCQRACGRTLLSLWSALWAALCAHPSYLWTVACGHVDARKIPPTTYPDRMRLVIARCTVDYVGRLTAHLPSGVRLLLVKADGSVSIHADDRAYKPLNWMSPPCVVAEADGVWRVSNRGGEELVVTIEEVLHDSSHELGVDPGLQKDGVEMHLQELLADRCETLGPGWTLVRREYPTDIGPVDLLCRDGEGAKVAVEIKRKGEIDGVEQLSRYLERLNRDPLLAPVRGILAAQQFTAQARVLARARGVTCVTLDYDALRGIEPSTPRLF